MNQYKWRIVLPSEECRLLLMGWERMGEADVPRPAIYVGRSGTGRGKPPQGRIRVVIMRKHVPNWQQETDSDLDVPHTRLRCPSNAGKGLAATGVAPAVTPTSRAAQAP